MKIALQQLVLLLAVDATRAQMDDDLGDTEGILEDDGDFMFDLAACPADWTMDSCEYFDEDYTLDDD